jgi:hypothetical protein
LDKKIFFQDSNLIWRNNEHKLVKVWKGTPWKKSKHVFHIVSQLDWIINKFFQDFNPIWRNNERRWVKIWKGEPLQKSKCVLHTVSQLDWIINKFFQDSNPIGEFEGITNSDGLKSKKANRYKKVNVSSILSAN